MASRFPIPYAPYSGSRDLRSFDPLIELHQEMDRLFDTVLSGTESLGTMRPTGSMQPLRLDVHEGEREISIAAELPGVKPSEVDVQVNGDILTISGEKRSETDRKQEDYRVTERSYGRFRRTVQLPFAPDPDQVRAQCEHGVLTVRLPKPAQQQRQNRRIEVRGAGEQLPGEQRPQAEDASKGAAGSNAGETAAKH